MKFIAIHAYINKKERSQINNLTLHFKQSEKEQTKPKVGRKKDITKNGAELNEIGTKKKKDNNKDQ